MNILARQARRFQSDSSATRPRWFRKCSRKRRARASGLTDQTSAHDPANGYLPEHWSLEKWKDLRKREPEEVAMSARESIASHVQAILQFKAMGIPCVDYGNNIRQEAKNAGVKNAFDYPASCRRTSGRCSASERAVPLGGAIGRCRRHRAHRCEGQRALSGRSRAAALARSASKKITSRACPRASAGWARQRHLAGLAFNEMVRTGELKAPIVIGRDHLDAGLGGEPEPGDRGDARRHRRGFGLAAPEPHAEHRFRRDLGVVPPWRRRRHGLLAARRHGDRLRRHRGRGEAHRACAVERPGERRDAPRGRRLRRSDRLRGREGLELPMLDARDEDRRPPFDLAALRRIARKAAARARPGVPARAARGFESVERSSRPENRRTASTPVRAPLADAHPGR